ncbi:MAG: glutamine ABC transporter substrate-binding protein [Verrucomicrobia bacterium]|nr:glutamine ABC transporter substrate-binding protein [Verrucomicrobiota bacterium]MCH8513042.1 glutamine ABC transporter substrate-binding protein [Kiritimatiellia bacterium]
MKHIIRTSQTLVFAAMVLLFSACGDPNTVSVATDSGFVPFEFIDENTGELIGFDIDLINAIAEEAGLELRINTMEFDGLIAAVHTGRHDMGIAGITITEARKEQVDFSDPYYDAGLIIAVRADNDTITSEADLAGKRVGTRSGTTSETYLRENHPDARIVAFPGIVEAYMDLTAGRVDAVLYDVPNVRYYASQSDGNGDGEQIRTIGDVLQGEQYGIVFPKGSPHVEPVNQALRTLRENGTYDEIHAKWFGEPADSE